MKVQNLKKMKISAAIVISSLAGMLPVTAMAHNTGYQQPVITVNWLPLLNPGYYHDHQHRVIYPPAHYYQNNHHSRHHPKRHQHHHNSGHQHSGHHQSGQHQPERVIRSHDGYANDVIIRKHFK